MSPFPMDLEHCVRIDTILACVTVTVPLSSHWSPDISERMNTLEFRDVRAHERVKTSLDPGNDGGQGSLAESQEIPGRAPRRLLVPVCVYIYIHTHTFFLTTMMSLLRVHISLTDSPRDAENEGHWVSTGWEKEPANTDMHG